MREQRLDDLGRRRVDRTRRLEGVAGRRSRAADRREEPLHLRDQARLRLEGGDPLDVARGLDERVVRDRGQRRVAAPAGDAQDEGRAQLLGRGAEVVRAPGDLDAVAGALVDGVLAAHGLGVLAAEPGEPEVGVVAHLLVGGGGEDQVAARLEPLARERGDRDRARRHLALHVQRPASPHLPVANLARPGVDGPLGRIGQDRVRVREEQQPRPVAAPTDPRHEVRPLRHARVQLALDAERLQVAAQQIGRRGLVPGRVDRVEADQLLEEGRDLLAQRARSHYSRQPTVSR